MRWSTATKKVGHRKTMQLEVLEDRQLLATITVNTTADDTTAGRHCRCARRSRCRMGHWLSRR